jgi:hypothetical protein
LSNCTCLLHGTVRCCFDLLPVQVPAFQRICSLLIVMGSGRLRSNSQKKTLHSELSCNIDPTVRIMPLVSGKHGDVLYMECCLLEVDFVFRNGRCVLWLSPIVTEPLQGQAKHCHVQGRGPSLLIQLRIAADPRTRMFISSISLSDNVSPVSSRCTKPVSVTVQ